MSKLAPSVSRNLCKCLHRRAARRSRRHLRTKALIPNRYRVARMCAGLRNEVMPHTRMPRGCPGQGLPGRDDRHHNVQQYRIWCSCTRWMVQLHTMVPPGSTARASEHEKTAESGRRSITESPTVPGGSYRRQARQPLTRPFAYTHRLTPNHACTAYQARPSACQPRCTSQSFSALFSV